MHLIELGEAFVAKYPMSYYAGAVYGMLTATYLATDQTDKMIDAGNKALALDPDNVDVLPILAWAIPRRVNGNSRDSLAMLQKAQGYAHHGARTDGDRGEAQGDERRGIYQDQE